MNTGWLSCTSSTVMANKACLVVLLVYVRETLIFVRLQMVSFCLFFFFVFSSVCLFVFLTERYHKRFSVVITLFANVCDTHDRIYIKSSDSPG